MLARLAKSVAAHPVLWIVGWLVVAAACALTTPSPDELARIEPRSLLASDEPYNRSLALEREAFPDIASRTRTVVIFESDAKLTSEHEAFLRKLSDQLQGDIATERGWTVISPTTQPLMQSRLRSEDGQSAMVVVCSDTNYLTRRSVNDVETIESMIAEAIPEGLRYEITGEGGLGRDLVHSSEKAFERTTHVTLIALLVILVIVYRAPLAASVPLCAIGLSVMVAIMLLNQCTRIGWELGSIEKTIVVVLLFGSGTDYALFWLAEYRSGLGDAATRFDAAMNSTNVTGPAIVASAATTVCGLLMLMAAKLLPSFNAGRALAIALTISLIAALTLVPAMAVVLGRGLYWPRQLRLATPKKSGRISASRCTSPAAAGARCTMLGSEGRSSRSTPMPGLPTSPSGTCRPRMSARRSCSFSPTSAGSRRIPVSRMSTSERRGSGAVEALKAGPIRGKARKSPHLQVPRFRRTRANGSAAETGEHEGRKPDPVPGRTIRDA